jgi:protein O-GlcNAc transferase
MEPSFKIKDKDLFYKYLNNSKIYFEYGSGGSTYQASIRDNIIKIYSVESDKEWLNTLEQKITSKNVIYMFNEMNVQPNTWGHPGPNSTQLQRINYSNQIRELTLDEQKSIDLILIDGRFRVACCLKCFDIINNDCLIVFDDFLDRPKYHVVLNYYDIVENTTDNSMVILQKKKSINCVPEELIKQYELISH